jgi:tripartite motif-containing protein 2/3
MAAAAAAAGGGPKPMEVLHRFGTLGHMQGQFNSPHGRIQVSVLDVWSCSPLCTQVFNKHAKFISVFGQAGKEDGQLWYPRKVAILRKGEHRYYIVCDRGSERSRMQIFTKDGNYVKKIGVSVERAAHQCVVQ